MKHIICGTDRVGSKSLAISRCIQSLYQEMGEQVEMLELSHLVTSLPENFLSYQKELPPQLHEMVQTVNGSDGLIFVVPEYNGSFPGILKYFIDHWSYPLSFEWRPTCFVGLGYRFGGLRPIEHLQGIMGYRNAFQYPERVFLQNIGSVVLADGTLEASSVELLRKQAFGFRQFCKALENARLTANFRTT